jgi:hypothetical protein
VTTTGSGGGAWRFRRGPSSIGRRCPGERPAKPGKNVARALSREPRDDLFLGVPRGTRLFSMMKHDHDSDTSRFPSGPWTGYFLDRRNPGQHRMQLDLAFLRGKINGAGDDRAGTFTIYGRYSVDGECRWTKEYGSHTVVYRGFREGKGIWGTWEISDGGSTLRGGFHIWPRGVGEGDQEAVEEALPAPDQLVGGLTS